MNFFKTMTKGKLQAVGFGALLYFFFYLARYNYPVALPFIKQEFSMSAMSIGWIATALTLGYMVGQFINGFLIDRKGPKIMFAIGGVGTMIANLFMGGNAIFDLFIFAWMANGYFQAMGYPSALKLIVNWFKPSERGQAVGINEALQSLASILILPLAGWLAASYNWRLIFFIPALLLGIATLVYYFNIKETPNKEPEEKLSLWFSIKFSYRKAFADWRLVTSYFSYGCCQFVRYAMITWIPTYLYLQTNMGIFKAAIIGMTFQIGGVLGSLLVGWLSDTKMFHGRKWILITIGMSVSAITGAMVGIIDPNLGWQIVAVLIICGAGIEALEVAYFLVPVDYLGNKLAATGVGSMNAVGKGFASVQGVFLGWIIDTFSYASAFGVAGIFGLLAAILIIPSGFRRK